MQILPGTAESSVTLRSGCHNPVSYGPEALFKLRKKSVQWLLIWANSTVRLNELPQVRIHWCLFPTPDPCTRNLQSWVSGEVNTSQKFPGRPVYPSSSHCSFLHVQAELLDSVLRESGPSLLEPKQTHPAPAPGTSARSGDSGLWYNLDWKLIFFMSEIFYFLSFFFSIFELTP